MLTLTDIAVAAGGSTLLAKLHVELDAGERVALTGPSGCGKTTLLRVVAGLIDPVRGEIHLRGRRPEEIGYPCFRRRVVLVAQRPVLHDTSLRANLARPFHYRSAGGRSLPESAARALLGEFGVAPERLDQPARSLSEGQQQRAGLVRALLLEPAVLLLDEPTSALDATAAAAVEAALVREAQHRGLAALVVTHDREQARRLCHRVLDLEPYLTEAGAQGAGGRP